MRGVECQRTGQTPVASAIPLMCSMEKLETPIDLTFDLGSLVIAVQVSTKETEVSTANSSLDASECRVLKAPGGKAMGQ